MRLSDMLRVENVRVAEKPDRWQDAIRLAIRPLLESGCVEARYAEAIIRATEQVGPYYVLTEEVALIHGRPEDGVIKEQLAVTVLRDPIRFSADGFDVRLLVALAARDSRSHIDAMKVLAGIFMDKRQIDGIVALEDAEAIYRAFIDADPASHS